MYPLTSGREFWVFRDPPLSLRLSWHDGTPASVGSVGVPHSIGGGIFLGWHERGYLPHFDAPWGTQFVTYMLWDSFPTTRRAEWEGILNDPNDSGRRRKLETWLDRGHGECWLRRAGVAVVEEELRKNRGRLYRLQAWAVAQSRTRCGGRPDDDVLESDLALEGRKRAGGEFIAGAVRTFLGAGAFRHADSGCRAFAAGDSLYQEQPGESQAGS